MTLPFKKYRIGQLSDPGGTYTQNVDANADRPVVVNVDTTGQQTTEGDVYVDPGTFDQQGSGNEYLDHVNRIDGIVWLGVAAGVGLLIWALQD